MTTTIHPRHTTARTAGEHFRIARRYQPSARELFPVLRERLHQSRPLLGWDVNGKRQTRAPRPGVKATPVYGPATFRNVIEGGEHL